MAHSCPACGQACYCNGDIDDICFDDNSDGALLCDHCYDGDLQDGDDYEMDEED